MNEPLNVEQIRAEIHRLIADSIKVAAENRSFQNQRLLDVEKIRLETCQPMADSVNLAAENRRLREDRWAPVIASVVIIAGIVIARLLTP